MGTKNPATKRKENANRRRPSRHYGPVHANPTQNPHDKSNLTDKHILIVDAYFRHGCEAGPALRELGYSEATIKAAARIMGHPAIRAEIKRRQEMMLQRFTLDEDWVIQRLMVLADTDIAAILRKVQENGYDLSCLSKTESYQIQEFVVEEYTEGRGDASEKVKRIKLKPSDRLGALNSLARRLGLFQDNVNVNGELSLVDRFMAGRKRVSAQVIDSHAVEVKP